VNWVPASLVFNVDETEYQEWANHSEQKIIVPMVHPGNVIDIPFNRSIKQQCSSVSSQMELR
jgi:hypothetical protein